MMYFTFILLFLALNQKLYSSKRKKKHIFFANILYRFGIHNINNQIKCVEVSGTNKFSNVITD